MGGWVRTSTHGEVATQVALTSDNNIGNSSGVSASVHAQARPRRCDHANRYAAMISGVGQACGLAASLTLASPKLKGPAITRGENRSARYSVCCYECIIVIAWAKAPCAKATTLPLALLFCATCKMSVTFDTRAIVFEAEGQVTGAVAKTAGSAAHSFDASAASSNFSEMFKVWVTIT